MTGSETSTLTDEQLTRIEIALDATPTDAVKLEGGEVGSVYRIDFNNRSPVAVKLGDTPFDVEARMLKYLTQSSPLPIPAVLYVESDLLVMAYVNGDGKFDKAVERDLADRLAALHDVHADSFGFPFETLSGPYWQPNPWTNSWIEFFREHRLCHFANCAHREGTLPTEYYRRIETLASQLADRLIEPDVPSLVHGDIHEANLIVEDGRVKAVLDPAIYFAHDEIELAFIDYVDSFGEAFFERYRDHREINPEFFETRCDIYTVFHSLENVRFFGTDLLDELDEALDRAGV